MNLGRAKLLSVILACMVLVLFQTSCKKKGRCEAKCDMNGNCEAKCSVEFEFDSAKAVEQTKAGQFDQILVLDLNKNYSIVGDRFSINASYKTDKGFTKTGVFSFRMDKAKRISSVNPNLEAYAFVPENKNLLDNFFREALANTTQKVTSNLSAKFTIKPKRAEIKVAPLSSIDLTVRAKLTAAETLGPLPVPWACCR